MFKKTHVSFLSILVLISTHNNVSPLTNYAAFKITALAGVIAGGLNLKINMKSDGWMSPVKQVFFSTGERGPRSFQESEFYIGNSESFFNWKQLGNLTVDTGTVSAIYMAVVGTICAYHTPWVKIGRAKLWVKYAQRDGLISVVQKTNGDKSLMLQQLIEKFLSKAYPLMSALVLLENDTVVLSWAEELLRDALRDADMNKKIISTCNAELARVEKLKEIAKNAILHIKSEPTYLAQRQAYGRIM